MGFGKRKIATQTVEVPGGETITVRGLDFNVVSLVYQRNSQGAEDLFQSVRESGQVSSEALAGLGAILIKSAPGIVADLITAAADADLDDPDDIAFARRLPIGVQVDALDKIAFLTFGEGGLGKLIATVIKAATETQGLVASLKA